MMNEEKRRGGCLIKLLVIVGVIAVVVGIGLMLISSWRTKMLNPYFIAAECRKYLEAIDKRDYEAAYKLVGDKFKEDMPWRKRVELEETLHRNLGKLELEKREMVYFNVSSERKGTVGKMTFKAQFKNGHCEIEFSLVKTGEKWLIEEVQHKSVVLLKELKCPLCGVTMSPFSNYCTECGNPIRTPIK